VIDPKTIALADRNAEDVKAATAVRAELAALDLERRQGFREFERRERELAKKIHAAESRILESAAARRRVEAEIPEAMKAIEAAESVERELAQKLREAELELGAARDATRRNGATSDAEQLTALRARERDREMKVSVATNGLASARAKTERARKERDVSLKALRAKVAPAAKK
jgi:hypothetical protein